MEGLIRHGLLSRDDSAALTKAFGNALSPMEILVAILRQFGCSSPIDIALRLNITEDAASEYQRRIRRKLDLEKGQTFDPIFQRVLAELKDEEGTTGANQL